MTIPLDKFPVSGNTENYPAPKPCIYEYMSENKIETNPSDAAPNSPLPDATQTALHGASCSAFFACDSVTHEGQTNTWFTPQEIVTTLGPFDLDPCTQTFRPYDTATRHLCEDAGECGLASKWEGRVWLNPPYGKAIPKWLGKLADHGNGIALVFSRTETRWGQAMIRRADAVNFIKGRIAFIRKDGKPSTNAGTGSMLLAFGRENVEAIKRLPGVIFMQNSLDSQHVAASAKPTH